MRTTLFMLGAMLLYAVCFGLARMLRTTRGSPRHAALGAFLLIWLVITLFNMWFGVARAGYSVSEELPVFMLLFFVPAFAAYLITRRAL